MSRTRLSPQRLSETKRTNIGRIIIFCEGKTEKYYFDYFAEIIRKNLFETWLLMHFENVEEKISKGEIYRRLSLHLYGVYSKGHKGKTREIIQNGNIDKAIDNAKALEELYSAEGKNIYTNIKDMNPFTSVYKLIEQFMIEISEY